jgi:aminoglycoside phosphotransferase (APT) family kinase protein
MLADKMHHDEIEISIKIAKELLAEQFPHWADLDLKPIEPAGSDNVNYKLGDDKVLRLPRTKGSSTDIDKELPLPLASFKIARRNKSIF